MQLKTDENGQAVIADGKPIYVSDSGEDIPVDVPALFAKVEELNGEAGKRRHKANELEERLRVYEGIDPDEARKALNTVKALSEKDLIEVGEVERVRKQAVEEAGKTWEEKLQAAQRRAEEMEARNRRLLVSGRFSASPSLKGTVYADAPGHAERVYGDSFKVEGDRLVATYNGETIYSKKTPGEPADFDEALSILIDRDPHRDAIKLTTVAKGGGAQNGSPGGGKGIDQDLPPAERVKEFRRQQGGAAS